MSDGGGDALKEGENNSVNYRNFKKRRSGIEDFTHSIAKVAVAQICEDAGFQGFQLSALDALSDVTVRYICGIGRSANFYANLACRNQCNVFDVIQGLEDLGFGQGFSSASDVHHCLSSSGVVRELVRYVGEAEEIPFAYSIPGFPVAKKREPPHSFAQTGVKPPAEHIPSWLPVFPDPETYVNLHLGNEKALQTGKEEGELVENHKDDEPASVNLQKKMKCNGSQPSATVNFEDAAKGKRSLECNPFLAPPLQHGEKDVSSVVLPTKLLDEAFIQGRDHGVLDNRISVLDAFAPAIEGFNAGRNIDSLEGRKDIPLNTGTTVRFKFFDGRKSFHRGVSSQKQEFVKAVSWFANDGANDDDKKRRAEQILKQSFESSGADSLVN